MRRVVLFVGLCAHGSAQDMRCKVGLSFSGLGGVLSGDYMGNGDEFLRVGGGNVEQLFLGFTWTDLDHPQHTTYGCDFKHCSESDKAIALGKWGIMGHNQSDQPFGSWHLRAVCESGCPDLKPSCNEIYNQPASDPDPLHCPIWPADWDSTMEWRIISVAGYTGPERVTAHVFCCKRRPIECDACSDSQTCSGLIGISHNDCPPNKGSLFHRQSKLQADCCVQTRPPPFFNPRCICSQPPTECDHGDTERVVV